MKRSYGSPIDYYQLSGHTMDPESGAKTATFTTFRIRKAVVLKAREFRSFVYDLAYISANKDFTAGGYFDPKDRRVILDRRDVPSSFEPSIDDYIIFKNSKYVIGEVSEFEDNSAFMFLARKLKGAEIVRIEGTLSVMDLRQGVAASAQDRLVRTVGSVLNLTHSISEVP